jgi:hypothetical protein
MINPIRLTELTPTQLPPVRQPPARDEENKALGER